MNYCRTLFLTIIVLFMFPVLVSYSQVSSTTNEAKTEVEYTNYRDCKKLYKLPVGKLFALALSSANANKYEILEMQSRNGYIIFEADNREFLLNVMPKDKTYSFLRLTPADNNYYFSPTIPQKLFAYIDANFNIEMKELKF